MDHAHHQMPTTTPCPMHAAKNNTAGLIASTVSTIINSIMGSGNQHGHHHHNHIAMDDGNSSDDFMMKMYFHGGYKEMILFDFWKTESVIIFLVSCLVLFIVAAFYEGIKLLRETLIRQEIVANTSEHNSDENARSLLNQTTAAAAANNNNNNNTDLIVNTPNNDNNETTSVSFKQAYLFQKRSRLLSRGHIIQTFLHMFQVTISYLLMLVFMTYNSWLCLSVILGAGVGYFFFGYKRLTTIDANEHCH